MTSFTRNNSKDYNIDINEYFPTSGKHIVSEDTNKEVQLESKYKNLKLIVEPTDAEVFIYDFDDANDIQIEGYNSITFDITPLEATITVRDSIGEYFELSKKTIFIPNNKEIYYRISCPKYDTTSGRIAVYKHEKNKHINIELNASSIKPEPL